MALERGEHRDAIAYAIAVGISAPLAVAAIGASEEVFTGPLGRLVIRHPAAASRAPPPSIVTAAASSSGAGVAPDIPPRSRRALGRRRRLRELAVEVRAGESIAPAGAPEVADLAGGRRWAAAGARTESVVHALVAESPVGLYVHGWRRLGFAGLGSRQAKQVYGGRSLELGARGGG